MWLKIIPNDTLFFRSGRSFTMGDDTWADLIFPPHPSTIYGALRTFYIFEKGSLKDFFEGKFKETIGTPKEKGRLSISGPFIYEETGSIYFKPPLDFVKLKGVNGNNQLNLLNLIDKPDFVCSDMDFFEKLIWYKGIEQVDEPDGWMEYITFLDYLNGKNSTKYQSIKDNEFFEKEVKIGIARERKTLTTKESHLYRIQFVRLKENYAFLVRVVGIDDLPKKGVLQLGGEGKTAFYEVLDENPASHLENMKLSRKDNMFKIYLATPAIFDKGWIPSWIDETSMEGEREGIKLKLISCAVGKYIRIGGWDMANRRPKPMYKAIPAGSVYYFKVLNGTDPEKIKNVFHLKNISDKNPEEGFGLSLVGVV